MIYVCAWCDAPLPYQAVGDDETVSHGICLDCVAGMMPETTQEAIDGMTATLERVGYSKEAIRAKFGVVDETFIGGTP